MSLRIIVRQTDCGDAANVGGDVHTSFRTFDIKAPEVEAWLCQHEQVKGPNYITRQVVGVEVRGNEEPSHG